MPGQFGTASNQDGLFASTAASDHVGVFGSNQSTNPPAGGGAGGAGVFGLTASPGGAGVFGANNTQKGVGVQGNGPEAGLRGFSAHGVGVAANTQSSASFAVFGSNDSTAAPTGGGAGGAGVFGLTASPGGAGVFGANNTQKGVGVQGNGPEAGVRGFSAHGVGVAANTQSNASFAVFGSNDSTAAPTGGGAGGAGVFGLTASPGGAGVFGANNTQKGVGVQGNGPEAGVRGFSVHGAGIIGTSQGGLAGRFEGDVEVTGDIRLVNADCAEDFDVANADHVEPGTVMVLGDKGALEPSQSAYDRRVAGIISGAGDFKPGIVLDKNGTRPNRKPIALLGKVNCKVDTRYGAIEIGDLLTTSPTTGHAMKATDPQQAFGAIIGKALRPMADGQGLLPILVALQ